MAPRSSYTDLLIIGAGPAGLMAACWASQLGIFTRIIDEKAHRTETGRADGMHSRTLEIFDSFGIADPILRRGIREVEMSYWGVNEQSGMLECQQRVRSQPDGLSRFGQVLLNQGEVEQVMIDYLEERGRVHIERRKRAEMIYFTDNCTHPVAVETRSVQKDRIVHPPPHSEPETNGDVQMTEVIHAQYVVACDGARSLVRGQLRVPLDEPTSTDSMWGVVDIVPITDFPDIRQSCAIHSDEFGSVMTAPRENRLVRFYVQLRGDSDLDRTAMTKSEESPDALIQLAQRVMQPYNLTYKYCDWWSIYPIKQGLVRHYQVNNRVFLVGDAAHTHSPKAGQGMNVSIQDSYNLIWKLGSVISGALDPRILETYEIERHPVAEELLRLDSRLVQTYEQKKFPIREVGKVRDGYVDFISGAEVTYQPNLLVSATPDASESRCSTNIRLGMRLKTVPVVNQADGRTLELARALSSNGAWRLLVFSGDLRRREHMERLAACAKTIQRQKHCSSSRGTGPPNLHHLVIEVLLIHTGPRESVSLLELPEVFHPFDEEVGWDYNKVFVDDGSYGHGSGHAYDEYGIDKQTGCVILCRPDQHVAWIGRLEGISYLNAFFSEFLRLVPNPILGDLPQYAFFCHNPRSIWS